MSAQPQLTRSGIVRVLIWVTSQGLLPVRFLNLQEPELRFTGWCSSACVEKSNLEKKPNQNTAQTKNYYSEGFFGCCFCLT